MTATYCADSCGPEHHAARPPLRPRRRRWTVFGTAEASKRPQSTTRCPPPFPIGEAYFVESVRAFREGAPAKLAEEIKAFTTQEAIHSREHDAFNKRAELAGYDLSKLEAQVEKRLAITRRAPPIVNLAATMALEHFTAILAHQLLADPQHLAGADRRLQSCGGGTRARRSSTRASPTTPGFTRPAIGRGSSAGR